jgi:SAM-dependent methyltransferase
VDIGCGFGHFVAWAADHGWDAWGVDDDVWARQRSRAPGRTVAGLDELDGEFDLATLWDVLEHVPDPVEFAASVARRVRRGGRVVAGSPNFAALRLRWPLLRLDPRRFSDVVRPDEHLVQFTIAGLCRTLERAGLERVAPLELPLSRELPEPLAAVARRTPALRRGIFAVGYRG